MKWDTNIFEGTKYDDLNMVVDKHWWYAHLSYDDGMILESGDGNTAVDAIINAMKNLTTKAQISFAAYAQETKLLPSFYWLDYSRFVIKGGLYEITNRNDKAVIEEVDGWNSIKEENLPFDPVSITRTNPPYIQVHNRLKQCQQTINWEREVLETME